MTDSENNMVSGLAQGLVSLLAEVKPPTHAEELAVLRQKVVARDYDGDTAAYLAWVEETFSSSDFPTWMEIEWLRSQTAVVKDYVQPDYPG